MAAVFRVGDGFLGLENRVMVFAGFVQMFSEAFYQRAIVQVIGYQALPRNAFADTAFDGVRFFINLNSLNVQYGHFDDNAKEYVTKQDICS